MVDHIVYGASDLDAAIESLERLLGVRAGLGGKHVGLGTHNALLGLGGDTYLEIIAPDTSKPNPAQPRPFGLDSLKEPGLVGWAACSSDIDNQARRAREYGINPGPVRRMTRDLPDGGRLEWRLTFDPPQPLEHVLPFLIDWGDSPHPSRTAPRGVRLVSLTAEHPDVDSLLRQLDALGTRLPVVKGSAPALVAVLDSPRGTVILRSSR